MEFNGYLKALKAFQYAFIICTVLFYIGCSDSNNVVTPGGNNNGTTDNADLSSFISSETPPPPVNVMQITEAKILIKDIKLSTANEDDKDFKVGPYVVYLNLGSNLNVITSSMIPPGVYDKIKFHIHKVNGNETPPDPEFADNQGRYSAIVKGTYNGVPFTYRSKQSAVQKLQFPGNFEVIEGGIKSNVTLTADVWSWFMDDNGNWMNPSDQSNSNEIDKNIKSSFKAFKDNDKNGVSDN